MLSSADSIDTNTVNLEIQLQFGVCKISLNKACDFQLEAMKRNSFKCLLLCAFLSILSLASAAELELGYYKSSCPNAESIIADYTTKYITKLPGFAADLLRLQFHDCFVRGCDASNLISPTKKYTSEQSAEPNLTIEDEAYDFIETVKDLLEAECPGVVSCADILALIVRDAIKTIGGPYWSVPTGRLDGLVSEKTDALESLPSPNFNFSTLVSVFELKGLDVNDLVILSGAHTIGIAHCSAFSNRLYDYNGAGTYDHLLDKYYVEKLKYKCKTLSDNETTAQLDPGSHETFDLGYYKNLLKRRVLFESDSALYANPETKSFIIKLVNSPIEVFFEAFAMSMEKLINIGVKTGSEGDIRKKCSAYNS